MQGKQIVEKRSFLLLQFSQLDEGKVVTSAIRHVHKPVDFILLVIAQNYTTTTVNTTILLLL